MEIYKFIKLENGGIYLHHGSCMFPNKLKDKINQIAKQEITGHGPPVFWSLINSFHISPKYVDLFTRDILPIIFDSKDGENYFIKDELSEANFI